MKNLSPKKPDGRALEGLLQESLRTKDTVDEPFVAKVMASLEGYHEAESSARHRLRTAYALAACFVTGIFLIVFLKYSTNPPLQTVAVIENTRGDVVAERNGKTIPLKDGETILLEDRIRCLSGASTTVRYSDGTKMDASGGQFFIREGANGQKKVVIKSGVIFCSVLPQPKTAPLIFETPHGIGEVLGTVFQLKVAADTTRLQTLKGKVRVRGYEDTQSWTSVRQGHFVSMASNGSLIAKNMDTLNIEPGDIIWSQEFGDEYGKEADLEGSQIQFKENGQLISAMRSRGVTNRKPEWSPDQWISLEMESREALFPAMEDMEIILRLRGEHTGEFRVALLPEKPKFSGEHVITGNISTPTEWADITIKTSDFMIFRKSRTITTGLLMRSLSVWGFGSGNILLDRVIIRRAPLR